MGERLNFPKQGEEVFCCMAKLTQHVITWTASSTTWHICLQNVCRRSTRANYRTVTRPPMSIIKGRMFLTKRHHLPQGQTTLMTQNLSSSSGKFELITEGVIIIL